MNVSPFQEDKKQECLYIYQRFENKMMQNMMSMIETMTEQNQSLVQEFVWQKIKLFAPLEGHHNGDDQEQQINSPKIDALQVRGLQPYNILFNAQTYVLCTLS